MPTIDELRSMAGREIGVSEWIEVTQDRIALFAEAAGDHQWIHTDPQRARRESPYGATVAPGFLTLSLLSELSRGAFTVQGDFRLRLNYGLDRVRFPAPVRAGARVRARFTLKEIAGIPGGVQLTLLATVETEDGGRPAAYAEWILRYLYAV
jgi:acyl dehydratase